MATNVSVSQLTGNFKEAYGTDLKGLYPDVAKLQKEIGELTAAERVGNTYHQPVILTKEQGYTYGGASAGSCAAIPASRHCPPVIGGGPLPAALRERAVETNVKFPVISL